MRNLTMLTDLYQLTMMYGYFKHGMENNEAVFDLFFRKTRENSAYAVMAGLESVINYINNLHFANEDIEYLRSLELFDEDFFNKLRTMRFTGELYAMPEGTIVFPHEPLLRIKAPIMQAQLIETALLNIVNHQTNIATKASRVVYAANGDAVLEFGLRRAQGPDAGIYGARAAIIGGCVATSNVYTGQMFHIAVRGTQAHSWVMSFKDELTAFRAYAKVFPKTCMLLVDTYDTLRSGIPNAIKVFQELREQGHEPVGVRLDSGDLAYLSKKAREMLDDSGFEKAKIFASSDLDETIIRDLKLQGAQIDVWGVGTRLITSDDLPAL
ncbi:MAG TPA: nicotinate phosphoribosyltransferase, partial [Clostridia bacterium]|nr:nicotinate phosphoribosyltransferase [Clostridia bacterium]